MSIDRDGDLQIEVVGDFKFVLCREDAFNSRREKGRLDYPEHQ